MMIALSRASHHRWCVVSRVIAAIFGGYVLASLVSIAGALVLSVAGVNKAEAVLAMTMGGFLIYAAIVMALFHARSARRAWLGLAIASTPPALFSALYETTIPWTSLFML